MNSHDLAVTALGLTGAYAIWSDVSRRRLPNPLCLIVAVLGLATQAYAGGWALAGSGLLHAIIALVIGIALFSAGIVGGGDAKYYAAVAAWFPLSQAGALLLLVSVIGFVLFVCWFLWRRLRGIKVQRKSVSDADKFPYGVAIALGAIAAMLAPGMA